jgi:PKHD-type hydroxylase
MSAVVLKGLLDEHEVSTILALARGKLIADDTSGKTAAIFGNLQRNKHRLTLPGTDFEGDGVARIAADAVKRSFLFQSATYPKVHSRPRLCCYGPGMDYRDHLDIPLIGKTQLRTDLSVTISLSDADSYEGGDLVIDSDGSHRLERRWKGDAGDCVVYPSDSVHRVEQVTRGERSVVIFWVHSLVRDGGRRQILFDLASGFDPNDPTSRDSPEAATMRHCHGSLLRMWADT